MEQEKVVCPPDSDGPCLSQQSEKPLSENPVDLRTCTVVTYESKDGLPGVQFLDNSMRNCKTESWTTATKIKTETAWFKICIKYRL